MTQRMNTEYSKLLFKLIFRKRITHTVKGVGFFIFN